MGKERVTYSCGHTGIIELFGAQKERDRKVAWLERSGLCPECYAAQRAAEIEARKQASARIEAACPIALPALVGTDKQIAWATDIRAGFLAAFIARGVKWDAIQQASHNLKVRAELDKLLSQSAKWWIDNRNTEIFGVARIEVPATPASSAAPTPEPTPDPTPASVVETAPATPAPSAPAYDRPMAMPTTISRNINDVRRAVCLQAWVLIRQGADKSTAFRQAWKIVKTA